MNIQQVHKNCGDEIILSYSEDMERLVLQCRKCLQIWWGKMKIQPREGWADVGKAGEPFQIIESGRVIFNSEDTPL